MLNIQTISNLRVFLERVQLTGKEVPAYNDVLMNLAAEERLARQAAVATSKERVVATGGDALQPSSVE